MLGMVSVKPLLSVFGVAVYVLSLSDFVVSPASANSSNESGTRVSRLPIVSVMVTSVFGPVELTSST